MTYMTLRFTIEQCSLGSILVAASERGVCAILLGENAKALVKDLQKRFPNARLTEGDATFQELVTDVVRFVDAPNKKVRLPLDIHGTAFQQKVWRALRAIPAGETRSYSDIASTIGSAGAVRAVASACAANPLAVAIPCHRVVRKEGGLSGYRWGVARKRALLLKEKTS